MGLLIRTRQAWTIRQKLSLVKQSFAFCSAQFLVYCPPWNQGVLHECWIVARCSLVVFFLFSAKGQWTTNTRGMFKGVLNEFYLYLEISCSHPCLRKIQKPLIPNCLPLFYFIIIFFQERDILLFSKGIYCCSPNFDLFSKTQTRLG